MKTAPADQKIFIASLDDHARSALTSRADAPGLVRLAQQWGLIVGLAVLISTGIPGWQLLLVPQGILLVFQFTLLHETVHETPFATPLLNRIAGRMASLIVIIPHGWFRYFHLAHHRHTQDPDNDPELASGKPETLVQYVLHVSGLPLWKSSVATLSTLAAGKCEYDYVPWKARARVILDARLSALAYATLLIASLIAGSALLFWIWILPLLLGQPFLRLYLLAEHGRCAFVANMFENTRTTHTNILVRWLAWNMPYHAEHHVWPMVPFHKLPLLHELAKDHLQVTENGYARFNAGYIATLD
ncbi:MAG: fatty acid desaturase [Nitratireductor sp.]